MDFEKIVTLQEEDGSVQVLVPLDAEFYNTLRAQGIEKREENGAELVESSAWHEGQIIFPGGIQSVDSYRSPRLSVPEDYYTRVDWSNEYYAQEPLVHALVNRDIDQAITQQELQMPEENEDERTALDEWRKNVNRGLGQYGGLQEYNRNLMLDLILSSFSFTIANWGPLLVGKKVYQFPKTLINLNPMSIIPWFDPIAGVKKYYYMLSPAQWEAIKKRRKNSISEIIPDARARLKTGLDFLDHGRSFAYRYQYQRIPTGGFYLELPTEGVYICSIRGRQQELYPNPTLVPIFSAIAMKRKLALADWAVADGMVNMFVVWKFPPATNPTKAKQIVQKFMAGGRVQSHAVPAGVEVQIVTPDPKILDSSDKFWVPVSEIMAHFGYPLNSKSRGAGDLDSGPLDLSSNRARLQFWRETIQSSNDYWLEEIGLRNAWDFDIYSIFQTRDLDDDANFRTFAMALWDRGALSTETLHDLAKTSTEREAARRKAEKSKGLDNLFEIRPTFSQTVGPATGGRPPAGSEKPKKTGDAAPKGQGAGQGRKRQGDKVQ